MDDDRVTASRRCDGSGHRLECAAGRDVELALRKGEIAAHGDAGK
jgi:hypothetical protein